MNEISDNIEIISLQGIHVPKFMNGIVKSAPDSRCDVIVRSVMAR